MNVRTAVVAVMVSACGQATSSTPDAGACQVTYAGNFVGTASTADACSRLTTAADGGPDDGTTLAIDFDAKTNQSVKLVVKLNLGASPTTGDVTSENVRSWSAVGLNAANNCLYSSGAEAVPPGNFTLTLTSATSPAHGTLHLEQYVQAPPSTDCGAGDTETVDITF